MGKNILALILVIIAVILSVISAILLKEATSFKYSVIPGKITIVFSVLIINIARLFLWSAIHKRYQLSYSYPLSSVFFPVILVVSFYYGDQIGFNEIMGTGLITLGVVLLIGVGKKMEVLCD